MHPINSKIGQPISPTIYLLLLCSIIITACVGQNEKDSSLDKATSFTISTTLKANQNFDAPFAQNAPSTA